MCHIFKLKTWIVFVAALLTACGQGPTPLPTETPILPTATTAAPIGSQASLTTTDLLARAEAAEKQMHSARLRLLQKTELQVGRSALHVMVSQSHRIRRFSRVRPLALVLRQ